MKNTIRFVIQHPWISLGGAIIVIVALVQLWPSSSEPAEPINQTPTEPQRPITPSQPPVPPNDNTPNITPGSGSERAYRDPRTGEKGIDPADYGEDQPIDERTRINTADVGWPALFSLPIDRTYMYARYVDQIPNSASFLIKIDYAGSKQRAQRTWRSFLKKNKDPGTAYVVIYNKVR